MVFRHDLLYKKLEVFVDLTQEIYKIRINFYRDSDDEMAVDDEIAVLIHCHRFNVKTKKQQFIDRITTSFTRKLVNSLVSRSNSTIRYEVSASNQKTFEY